MNKRTLIDRAHELLRAEHAAAERVARETAAAANHPEAKPENDKDTRKIELSYLAAGQAARAEELAAAVAAVGSMDARPLGARDPVRVGALVSLDVDGKAQRVLVLPAGGGLKLASPEGEVSVVTPEAPLGRGLLGQSVGDGFELTVAGKKKDVEILGVE
jgi:transcription elongation GreA/GreB family factor